MYVLMHLSSGMVKKTGSRRGDLPRPDPTDDRGGRTPQRSLDEQFITFLGEFRVWCESEEAVTLLQRLPTISAAR